MKKVCVFTVVLLLLLSGCAKTEKKRFIVSDEILTDCNQTEKLQITVCLPEGITEAVSAVTDDCRLFEAADGSYYVVTQVLTGQTADKTIREMTGADPEAIGALRTINNSLPEYRFSWCMEGENGLLSCTGIVVEDQDYCYALQFCAQEEASKECIEAKQQVLTSFALRKG